MGQQAQLKRWTFKLSIAQEYGLSSHIPASEKLMSCQSMFSYICNKKIHEKQRVFTYEYCHHICLKIQLQVPKKEFGCTYTILPGHIIQQVPGKGPSLPQHLLSKTASFQASAATPLPHTLLAFRIALKYGSYATLRQGVWGSQSSVSINMRRRQNWLLSYPEEL